MPGNELNADLSRIQLLEEKIERGLQSCIEVGLSLAEIKNNKLYNKLGYKSFDLYCQERWGLKRTHAFSQIKAAQVVQNLSEKTFANGEQFENLPAPQNERQVRPLIGLQPSLQRSIWQEAVKITKGKNPTGKIVKQVKEKIMNQSDGEDLAIKEETLSQLEIGDIAIVQAKDINTLKAYQGYWCVIKAKSDHSSDVDVYDKTLTLLPSECLVKLECTEEEKQAARSLMSRMQRIASIETVSFLINSCLITLNRGRDFNLPDRDQQILTFIENQLGITNN